MTSKKAAEALFNAMRPDTPWDRTNDAARQIISDQVRIRDANVARLRDLRAAQAENRSAKSDTPRKRKPQTKK